MPVLDIFDPSIFSFQFFFFCGGKRVVLQVYFASAACQGKHLKQGKVLTVHCVEPDALSSIKKAKAD